MEIHIFYSLRANAGCSHQKQALTFMLRREKGLVMEGSHTDIWKKTEDRDGHTMYGLCNQHTSLLLIALDIPTSSPINNKTLHHLSFGAAF